MSSIFSMYFISILTLLRSILLNLDIKIHLKPNLAASFIQRFILDTGLSSPERPISAAKQIFLLIDTS